MTTDQMIMKLQDLPSFIRYLEATEDSEWLVDKVRDTGNKRNCVFGHLVNWFYGPGYEGSIMTVWDSFEGMWATAWELYDINDGHDARYPQATPKARVIKHLMNLWLGLAKPTWVQMNEDLKKRMEGVE